MAGMQGTDVTYVTRPSRQLLDRDTYFILSGLALTVQKLVKSWYIYLMTMMLIPSGTGSIQQLGVDFEVPRWK
jgi:hypothetical protein